MKIICAILIVFFQYVNCDSSFLRPTNRLLILDLLITNWNQHSRPIQFHVVNSVIRNVLADTINEVIKSSSEGIPEIDLGSIDPLIIGKSSIEQGARSSAVNIKIRMTNANLLGSKQFIVKKVVGFQKDPKTSKFEIHGYCPRVTVEGSYQISGKVLLLPVGGKGISNISLYNNDISMKFITHTENRKNEEYLVIDDIDYDSKASRMFINMSNLFNDATISKSMNDFFNENQFCIKN